MITATIEADESAKLVFDIINADNSPSYNIIPIIKELNENKHLTFSPRKQISYLPKGDQVRYVVTIRADKRLKDEVTRFRLYTTENNGAMSDVHKFSLPLRKR